MTDVAAIARENALTIEVKKDRMSQRQNGDWAITFVLHPNDLSKELMQPPMGTRYIMALCEVQENGEPVVSSPPFAPPSPVTTDQPASAASIPDTGAGAGRVKTPAQMAGFLCTLPAFQRFLVETHSSRWNNAASSAVAFDPETIAAYVVRQWCGVYSRADIILGSQAARALNELLGQFRAWEKEAEVVPSDAGEPW